MSMPGQIELSHIAAAAGSQLLSLEHPVIGLQAFSMSDNLRRDAQLIDLATRVARRIHTATRGLGGQQAYGLARSGLSFLNATDHLLHEPEGKGFVC